MNIKHTNVFDQLANVELAIRFNRDLTESQKTGAIVRLEQFQKMLKEYLEGK